MATTPNGIMALPENDEMGAPQLSLNESYDAMRQGLKNARPDAATDLDSTMAEILPQLEGMPDDVIDKLLQTVQYLKDNPDQYAEIVAKLIGMGVVKEGDFPPEYDPEFLATMGVVLLETQRSRSEAPAQPTGFAKGGIADAARIMASKGRGRDSMLAHITPNEARLLRSRGGMGTRNPSTGLPEYGFLDDLWGGIKGAVGGVFDAVKGVLKSPIGRVLGTIALGAFLGPGAFGITGMGLGAAAAPLASGIISGFSGGSAMDMLTSAATSYLGSAASPLSEYVGKMTSGLNLGATASQALTSGLVGTGVGMLTGKSLEDSVASGLQGAAMNAAMDQLNAGKAPVPDADRAPVPGLAPDIGSGLKPGDTSKYGNFKPPSYGLGTSDNTVGLKPPPEFKPSSMAPIPAAATAAPAAASAGYKQTSLMDSMGKMFTPGRFMEGAKETFFPSGPTDEEVLGSSQFEAFKKKGFTGEEAFKRASSSMAPDMFRQYGPLVAAGLGATAAFGGFEPQKLEKSAQYNSLTGGPGSAKDLRSKNPRKYDIQGLPGVMYSPEGAIIGYRSPSGVESLYAKGGAVKSARKTKASTTGEVGALPISEWEARIPEDFYTLPYFPDDPPVSSTPYTPYNNTSNYGNLMNPTKYVRPPAKALPPRPVAAEYGYKPTRPPVTRPEPLRPPVPGRVAPPIRVFPDPMPPPITMPRELTKSENDAAARKATEGTTPGRMGSAEALAAFRREQEEARNRSEGRGRSEEDRDPPERPVEAPVDLSEFGKYSLPPPRNNAPVAPPSGSLVPPQSEYDSPRSSDDKWFYSGNKWFPNEKISLPEDPMVPPAASTPVAPPATLKDAIEELKKGNKKQAEAKMREIVGLPPLKEDAPVTPPTGSVAPPAALPVNQNGDTRARKADTPGMVQIGTTSGGKPMYGPAETNPYQGSAAGSVAPPAALPVDSPPQTGPTAASRGETIIDAAATPPPAVQKLPAAATATPPRMVQTNTGPNGRPIYGPEAAPAAPASGGIMSLNNAGAPPQEELNRRDDGPGGGGGFDGGGGMAKGGYINKRAPYTPRGDVANGPVWGPGGMVYPSRSVALAMGVPADKIFKTAFEAYQGKANVAPTPVPPAPVPPIPVPPTPVPPPVIIDGGGGNDGGPGGNDGGGGGGSERVGGPPNYDYGGSSYGAPGSQNTNIGFLSGLLGNKGQMPAPIEDRMAERAAADKQAADKQAASDAREDAREAKDAADQATKDAATSASSPTATGGIANSSGIASLGVNLNAGELSDRTPATTSISDRISALADNARAAQAVRAADDREERDIENAKEAQAAAAATAANQAANQAAVDAAAFAGAQQAQEAQAQADREASTSTAPASGPSGAPPGGGDVAEGGGAAPDGGFGPGEGWRRGGYIGSYAQGGMGASGIASLLQGGYPRKMGEIAGPGTGTSDDIPAMLSDGEFVMTAKAVRGAGKGSRRDGAKRMYALMHQLERNAARG